MKPILIATFICHLLYACTSARKMTSKAKGEIIQQGFINCFDTIVTDALGNPVHCEASAVVADRNSLIIASDKEIPATGLSPVFSIPLMKNFPSVISSKSVTHLTANSFLQVRKIEDMTKEPSGNICFATTGFDRIRDTSVTMDAYNSLLYWKEGDYSSIRYVEETTDAGVKSSKSLRSLFAKALATVINPDGPRYFKVEAICALPDSTLLFGVRETGSAYYDMEYACIVLSTKYHVTNGVLTLDSVFKKVFGLNPKQVIGIDAGLSGMAYNKQWKEIYFSTSVEEFSNTDSARFSAYLWKVPLKDFYLQKPAQIIKDKSGNSLHIDHKVEGITFISKNILLTVSDQDRSTSPINIDGTMINRKPSQAVYGLIKLKR